jgi:hypothetical protein
MKSYRVVEWGIHDNLEVISVSLSSYEAALEFMNSDLNQKHYSNSFIIREFSKNEVED